MTSKDEQDKLAEVLADAAAFDGVAEAELNVSEIQRLERGGR